MAINSNHCVWQTYISTFVKT